MTVKALFCGSRDWSAKDRGIIQDVIDRLPPNTTVIHGGAPGADIISAEMAKARGLGVIPFRADWNGPARKLEGPLRNKRMLDDGDPILVHAFIKDPVRCAGTANMIVQALLFGAVVFVHRPGEQTTVLTPVPELS